MRDKTTYLITSKNKISWIGKIPKDENFDR